MCMLRCMPAQAAAIFPQGLLCRQASAKSGALLYTWVYIACYGCHRGSYAASSGAAHAAGGCCGGRVDVPSTGNWAM
jgi:hypothetical protein